MKLLCIILKKNKKNRKKYLLFSVVRFCAKMRVKGIFFKSGKEGRRVNIKNQNILKLGFLLIMALFGCLGPLIRAIGLPVSVTACLRAWISSAALVLFMLIARRGLNWTELKKIILPMLFSGALLAGDWIGLFMSYQYTTIAVATVCYYIVPILLLIASPFVLGEKITLRHWICILVAFGGMALVSGVTESGFSASGILGPLFAFFGAVCYAVLILINKRFPQGDVLVRTTLQLFVAAVLTTPYVLLTVDSSALVFTAQSVFLLLLLSVGMTALTYIFYFWLVVKIPARSVAIFSYADPVVAVLISVFFLGEPMTLAGAAGTVLVIGAAMVSELKK